MSMLRNNMADANLQGLQGLPPPDHKFWKTQPVLALDEETDENGPIEPNKPMEELRQDPYRLPAAYEWVLVDIYSEVIP